MRVDSVRVGLDSLPINGSVMPAAPAADADWFSEADASEAEVFVPIYEYPLICAFVSGQRPGDSE